MSQVSRLSTVSTKPKIIKSVCRACHGGCSALLHVKDGKLVKVVGDPAGPFNQGRLCPIGASAKDIVYHPDRLHYPMRRLGKRGSGEWERITWDQAYDEIAGRLGEIRSKYGPEAVALGQGTGRRHFFHLIRFANALGTPNWSEPGSAQCFLPRVTSSMHTFGDFPVCDFVSGVPPKCILYWGHNPTNSGPDGETRFNVRDSLASNPKVIVVDPRETDLTKRADIWLRVRPGADDALALTMLNVIIGEKLYDADFVEKHTQGFDALAAHVKQYTPEWAEPITWVPADKIRAAARLYAETRPAMLEWGVAVEQTPKCLQSCRALSMLQVLTGNIDVPGGWIFGMHSLGPFPFLNENLSPEVQAKRLGADRFKVLSGEGAVVRTAHIPSVMKAMREGVPYPVKAFLVFGNNTLTTYGNSKLVYESLMKLDFMVCADLFMTPTAELADIVLPAASWPEADSLWGYPFIAETTPILQQKAVSVGECKADEEIFADIAKRMNLPCGTESVEDVMRSLIPGAAPGITFERLQQEGFVQVPMRFRKYEEKGFPTASGKIELYSTVMESLGYPPLPSYEEAPETPFSAPNLAKEFPLVLTTGGRIPSFFCSEHRQVTKLRAANPDPITVLHPDTAARYGIADGDWMWIETLRGRVRQKARLVPAMDPRVISSQYAWWFPEQKDPEHGVWTSNINVLTNIEPPYDPAMGTYQLRALLCRIEKAEAPF